MCQVCNYSFRYSYSQNLVYLCSQKALVLPCSCRRTLMSCLWQYPAVMVPGMCNAGSHDMEVSSGVHQAVPNACLPSRFSKEAPAGNTERETSSLQTLAAAADSGAFDTRNTHCRLIHLSPSVILGFMPVLQVMRQWVSNAQKVVCRHVCKADWHHLQPAGPGVWQDGHRHICRCV